MKKGIIYEWRNKLDDKFYVGQTIHPESRYKDHLKAQGDSVFHRAIRLHGIENFEYSVVAAYEHETEQGLYDLLNEAEVERIKFRNSLVPNGYNVADGGRNGNFLAGYTQEQYDEYCKNRSKMLYDYYSDPKNREKRSGKNNPNYGKPHSTEWCKKISDSHKGKKLSDEHVEKIRISKTGKNNPNYGKPRNDDTKRKIGDKNRGKTRTNEQRKTISIATSIGMYKYYENNPERKELQRINCTGDKNPMKRDDLRKQQGDRIKGDKNPMKNPETVKKMADAKRGKPSSLKGKSRDDMKGDNNPAKRQDVRKKISEKNKGRCKGMHWKLVDGKRVWY